MQRYLFTNFNDFIATKIITRIFVVVARNTFILITNKSINKMKLFYIVKKAKNDFQMLQKVIVIVANTNLRF